jgi:hypothetical protein
MKRILFAFLCLFISATPALAKDNINLDLLNQSDFKSFSEDFGMAMSYQPLSPAAPLGDKLFGFDIGVEASYAKLDSSSNYYLLMHNPFPATVNGPFTLPETLYIPRVHVQFGLPILPIDIGASYGYVENTDIKVMGAELKWAILRGSAATPALAIRGAYTKISGLDTLDLSTASADISISKGILIFTPYAGVGEVWIASDPKNQATHIGHLPGPIAPLQKENIAKPKAFVGTKIKIFPFINLDIEGDFANVNVYSARLNVNF